MELLVCIPVIKTLVDGVLADVEHGLSIGLALFLQAPCCGVVEIKLATGACMSGLLKVVPELDARVSPSLRRHTIVIVVVLVDLSRGHPVVRCLLNSLSWLRVCAGDHEIN